MSRKEDCGTQQKCRVESSVGGSSRPPDDLSRNRNEELRRTEVGGGPSKKMWGCPDLNWNGGEWLGEAAMVQTFIHPTQRV